MLEGCKHCPSPVFRDDPAAVGDADQQGPGAASRRVGDIEIVDAQVDGAPGKTQLPDTCLGTPIVHADRRLARGPVGRVAEEQEIGLSDFLHG